MIKVFAYAKIKREEAQRNVLTWATAPGKYKMDNQRGWDIPARHLSVSSTVMVELSHCYLCPSSYPSSQLSAVALTLELNFRLLAFGNTGMLRPIGTYF